MTKIKKKITEVIKSRIEKANSGTRKIVHIPIDEIFPDPEQPRQTFHAVDGMIVKEEQDALVELSQSIKDKGVIQPILLFRLSENQYRIIVGERRWRAAQMAGLQTIPAEIREDLDPRQVRMVQIIENIQREDMSDFDTARFLKKIIEVDGIPRQQLAKELGKSPSYVTRMLGFLDEKYQYLIEANIIKSSSVLEQFKSLPSHLQEELIAESRNSNEPIKLAMIQKARQAEVLRQKEDIENDPELILDRLISQSSEVQAMIGADSGFDNEMPSDDFAQAVQGLQKEFEAEKAKEEIQDDPYKPYNRPQIDASNDNIFKNGISNLPPVENSELNVIEVVELTMGQLKKLIALKENELDNTLPVSVRLPMQFIKQVVSEKGPLPENDRNIISVFSRLI